jgi:hypothetical protein
MLVRDPQVRGSLGEMGLRRYRQRFSKEKEIFAQRGENIILEVPHKNLWAKLGSGRLPRPWYSASLKVSAVLYP